MPPAPQHLDTADASAVPALLRLLEPARRRQLAGTLALMLLGAAAELATVAAVIPFLAALTGTAAAGPGWLTGLTRSPLQAAALLAVVAISSAAVRLALARRNQAFVRDLGHDLAVRLFGTAIRLPFQDQGRRNSSAVLAGLEQVNSLAYGVVQPVLNAVVAGVIAIAVVAVGIALQPAAALIGGAWVAIVYLVVLRLTRRRLVTNSAAVAEGERRRIQAMQESLGGIRDIILDRSWSVADARFAGIDAECRRRQAELAFAAAAPRPIVEAGALASVAVLVAVWGGGEAGLLPALPVLGALLLAGQRLIPLLNQVYVGFAHTAGHARSLHDVLALLNAPRMATTEAPGPALPFRDAIRLEGVGFRYGEGAFALRGVDLVIPRGARVGVTGPTGGGKSTLLDLVMGLLAPTEGTIAIDGVPLGPDTWGAWHAQVAHVPQSVFLADASLAANIAFGATPGTVDLARVREAARQAELGEFIDGLPERYETVVGERGVRLSGGQRQRIGLARAFYKRAGVLVLDEATSALDDATEAAILRTIEALPPETTVITVAHRASALANCRTVHRMVDGRLDQAARAD